MAIDDYDLKFKDMTKVDLFNFIVDLFFIWSW